MKIAIVGHTGRIGNLIKNIINQSDEFVLVGSISSQDKNISLLENADVVIDFSNKSSLDMVLSLKKPLVIGTTGYDEKDFLKIKEYAEEYPVIYSSNYSIGMAVCKNAIKEMTNAFSSLESIDIIEMHHNKKKDKPSGSAITLKSAIEKNVRVETHSIRAANIIGNHSVLLHAQDEMIEIKHSVSNREVFAKGALLAAQFIYNKEPKLYSIDDLLFQKQGVVK